MGTELSEIMNDDVQSVCGFQRRGRDEVVYNILMTYFAVIMAYAHLQHYLQGETRLIKLRLLFCFMCPTWPIIDIVWTALRGSLRLVLARSRFTLWLGQELHISGLGTNFRLVNLRYYVSTLCGAHVHLAPEPGLDSKSRTSVPLFSCRTQHLVIEEREESRASYLGQVVGLALTTMQCIGTMIGFGSRWQTLGDAGMIYSDVAVFLTATSGFVIIIPSWLLLLSGLKFRSDNVDLPPPPRFLTSRGVDFATRLLISLTVSFFGAAAHAFGDVPAANTCFCHAFFNAWPNSDWREDQDWTNRWCHESLPAYHYGSQIWWDHWFDSQHALPPYIFRHLPMALTMLGLCQTLLILLYSQKIVFPYSRGEEREKLGDRTKAARVLERSLKLICDMAQFFGWPALLLCSFSWRYMGTLKTVISVCFVACLVLAWGTASIIVACFRFDDSTGQFMVASIELFASMTVMPQMFDLLDGYRYTAGASTQCWPLEDRCKLLASNPKWTPGF